MKIERNTILLKELPYGECCTLPKYDNNMLLMRVKTNQRDVMITIKGSTGKSKCKMLDLETGEFHLVNPWEPVKPVDTTVSIL